jgi:hypothetical protein
MFITLQENISQTTDALNELLAALGYGADRPGTQLDLDIDRFDQWSNPKSAALTPSSCGWYGTGAEAELERVA